MASSQPTTASSANAAVVGRPALGVFERYLTLWVALCIVVGIALGHWLPAPFHAIGRLEVAQVNLPDAVLIWLMIIPMLIKIDLPPKVLNLVMPLSRPQRRVAVLAGLG